MVFEKSVQTLDEFMTTNQAGEKNQRGQDFDCSRIGTAPFSVLTDFGRISLMLNKIKNERLVTRISKTKNKLTVVAQSLLDSGYQKARNFIIKHLETVTLFAKEAVNQVKVPWTNNIMERFIGEVSFRIKNRWAHWGKEGLNAIIHLIIQKYCKRNQVKLEF